MCGGGSVCVCDPLASLRLLPLLQARSCSCLRTTRRC